MSLSTNYDTRAVGVPYLRVPRIEIGYPAPGSGSSPDVTLRQVWAVKLEGGAIEVLQTAPEVPVINAPVDATSQTPIPLVDPDSGLALDAGTRAAIAGAITSGVVTMPIAMLVILAVARSLQTAANPAPGA
jgi:hypothetical protein